MTAVVDEHVALMAVLNWRTHWKGIVLWGVALVGTLVATAAGIAGLYDTPAKIHSYAQAVAGGSLYAINGRVEGIDSLGGVIQDEFGFLAAFLLPLAGISLVARATRLEEEQGRLEALLARRAGRRAPTVAALLVTAGALGAVAVGFAVGLLVYGVPLAGAALYAGSLSALGFAFAGLAALLAQLTLHTRSVYACGFAVLVVSYVVRGIGDVTGSWLTWLSPLGWQEKVAPFGPQRWWALALPMAAGTLLGAVAVLYAGRRDVGSARFRGGPGPAGASPWLRRPIGLALWVHRPALLGWLLGSLVLAGTMGALTPQVVDALAGNPSIARALGASATVPEAGFLAVTQLYLALLACGFAVQAVGGMRREEADGRLEATLATAISRLRWLAGHVVVVLGGVAMLAIAGSASLAVTDAWAVGDTSHVGTVLRAGLAYLPAELVLAGVALALFGVRPRAQPAAWAAFATTTGIAFLGPGLQLPGWVRDLAPTTHVGNPPQGNVDTVALVVLTLLAALLVAVAGVGFRRRAVPQG